MRVPTYSPPPGKVFHLACAGHLLSKLCWEVAALERSLARQSDEMFNHTTAAYHAFNAAVTAWHMTDWVWDELTTEMRGQLAKSLGSVLSEKKQFQNALVRQCRGLHICRQIANGSKHKTLTHEDPQVRAAIEWTREPMTCNSGVDEPIARFHYRLEVSDGATTLDAINLFTDVARYWRRFLANCGLMEDEFITGPDV